ncbi:MAG: DNA mismatch repair protein MutS [Holophagales bacterium]|nr:DNA mismatch repair protein MutS [Holophagales bacterium]MYD21471.1 DNA mismatch repair protein MutS [Holophagales bacterium]MYI32725.1 DNA mismatch repair protein MutS [Holophagales bacterium]
MSDPRSICEPRAAQRDGELRRTRRFEKTVSWSRLAAVLAAAVLVWLSVQARLFPLLWAAVPALLFLVLVVLHERVLQRAERLKRARAFYRFMLDRLDGDWRAGGRSGSRFTDDRDGHVYAADLDLFGPDSLFRLLSRARTRSGEELLASWLLRPAPPDAVRRRQEAVRELAPGLDFRERLAATGRIARTDLDPEALVSWAEGDGRAALPGAGGRELLLRALLVAVAAANLLAVTGWLAWSWGPSPFLGLAVLQILWSLAWRQRFRAATAGVRRASRDLNLVASLLEVIEREPFESTRLVELDRRLRSDDGVTASRSARQLQRLVDLLDSMRNAVFAPFGLLLLWTPQLAYAIDSWRRRHGDRVTVWLRALAEVEALASLASHAFENPDRTFPTLVEPSGNGRPLLDGRELGHPLLPAEECVANDVFLAGPLREADRDDRQAEAAGTTAAQCLIVSGSNMSGKSTLLRTVGTNVALAQAGAPVRARSLRLTPLAIGSSIQLHDSLAEGQSRFYAEITKLKSVLDLTEQPTPVLFLLDEILHGTNSHDRRVGAEALVRGLLDRGAIGLVTTHDLALARIAGDSKASSVRNVHFQDDLEDGEMRFDYRLREGTVTRSNALDLMRQVGLDV